MSWRVGSRDEGRDDHTLTFTARVPGHKGKSRARGERHAVSRSETDTDIDLDLGVGGVFETRLHSRTRVRASRRALGRRERLSA
jgi:hypothetical protein